MLCVRLPGHARRFYLPSILALEDHGAIAGTASSLIGTLQFGLGSVVMAFAGGFANGAPLPMITGVSCRLLCVTFPRSRSQRATGSRRHRAR